MSAIKAKIKDALVILEAIGVPVKDLPQRRKERVALALLAIANISPTKAWAEAAIWNGAGSHLLTTRQVISFWNKHYAQKVSSGSYDDVRRKDLIYLIESGIALKSAANPEASTNNPTRGYAVSPAAQKVLRLYGTLKWRAAVKSFRLKFGSLESKMQRSRGLAKIPVKLPSGLTIKLTLGPHNELQRAIIEEFLPRFLPGATVLYVGDTTKKSLVVEAVELKRLGFFELSHDALPDVVAYDQARNWLVLVEAVHSANPISPLRHLMLERMTEKCTAPRVYVSAFRNRQSFREWVLEISWETEVWLSDAPDHLIHFNGDKFLGPHQPSSP